MTLPIYGPGSEENVVILTGDVFFKAKGEDAYVKLGYCEGFAYSPEVQTEDVKAPNGPNVITIKTLTKEVGASISIDAMEASLDILSIVFLGKKEVLTQAAVTDREITLSKVTTGTTVDCGALKITGVTVSDTADPPVAYTLDTHYKVLADAGVIEIFKKPAEAGDGVKVIFSAPVITTADGHELIKLLSDTAKRGHLMVVGENENGPRYKVSGVLIDFQPSGDVKLIGKDAAKFQLKAKAIADTNAAAIFGKVERIA